MSITIATINLNNAHGLERTLLSFKYLRNSVDLKFVFQDGASIDNSLAIAARFYKPNEIISEPDDGIYDAMNKTLARAETEYIIWINSGDVILPEYWPSLISEVQNSKSDIFISSIELAEESGEVIREMKPEIHDISKGFSHPGTFFRCGFIKGLGGYKTKYRIAGDLELILRSARNGAIVCASDKIASKFYLGGMSSTKKVWYETWLAHYENRTITWVTFTINKMKLFMAEQSGLFKSFRHKKLSAIGPEKKMSIFQIGAKKPK